MDTGADEHGPGHGADAGGTYLRTVRTHSRLLRRLYSADVSGRGFRLDGDDGVKVARA